MRLVDPTHAVPSDLTSPMLAGVISDGIRSDLGLLPLEPAVAAVLAHHDPARAWLDGEVVFRGIRRHRP